MYISNWGGSCFTLFVFCDEFLLLESLFKDGSKVMSPPTVFSLCHILGDHLAMSVFHPPCSTQCKSNFVHRYMYQGSETAHVSYTFALNNGHTLHVIVSIVALLSSVGIGISIEVAVSNRLRIQGSSWD